MSKNKTKKNKPASAGYLWTNPANGYLFAVVYQTTIDPSGRKTRKKKTRRIPEGATKAQAETIMEDLAAEAARELDQETQQSTARANSSKKISGHTLTWRQLGDWYVEHYQQPPVFNSDRHLIAGSLTWKGARRKINFLVDYFGPTARVRDLTLADLKKFKETRLRTPIVKQQKKRNPNDPRVRGFLRDKKGNLIWETIETERSIGTVHRDLAMVRILLNHAAENDWLVKNPWHRRLINPAAEKKRETIATQAQELALLEQCGDLTSPESTDHKSRRHLLLYLTVMFDSGCRSAELRRLLVKDVDFEANQFFVYSYKGGKRTGRPFPMTPRARVALLECCNPSVGPGKTGEDFVFTYNVEHKRHGKSIAQVEYRPLKNPPRSLDTARRLAKWWSNEEINLDHFRGHDIRHTTITRLVKSNLPIAEIMKLSGHTQMGTFLRYVNPDQSSRVAAAEALHNYSEPTNVVNIKTPRTPKAKKRAA